MITFLRAHWRKLAVALALALAFASGRAGRPLPDVEVVELERVVEREVEVVRWREAEAKTRIVYRDRTTAPDGTTRDQSTTITTTDRTASADASTTKTQDAQRDLRRVETQRLPDWRAGALVGFDGGIVYGAHVERRIAGPLSAGVWAHGPRLAGGVSLSLEF